ncbi:hypothetical protein GYMLUDRAFT_41196 [Collybiopsis luxurians FD-317 M1]|uniref:C3H1-type domain-containing protein n=1 Tax=Collybiopsis luxurians FD-317 M1 TaxID=944289 RepID=A0A0D0C443_9AGAR|nr:hypothetical protein GYMLUDRAFT_41196 [Collybiopsis luxurians FD-317 M1]
MSTSSDSAPTNARLIRYYSKLVETYIQLSLYEEAEATASRILTVDPSNIIVRLKRGHARRRIGHFVGALVDFETVIAVPPKPDTAQLLLHDEALRQRDIVVHVLGCSYADLASCHADKVAQYNEPAYTQETPSPGEKEILPEPLPKPCRFHNHLGCRRGKKCSFSHAPDARSIRDNRGKNVCLYYLIGKCKWDMFTCIYSHSKGDLPSEYKVDDASKPSWWDDPLRLEAVRVLVDGRNGRRKKLYEQHELAKQRNSNKKSKKKKKKNGKGEGNQDATDREMGLDQVRNSRKPSESSSSHSNGDGSLIFDWESDSDDGFEEEIQEEDEFEDVENPVIDLLSYGVAKTHLKSSEDEETKTLTVAPAS